MSGQTIDFVANINEFHARTRTLFAQPSGLTPGLGFCAGGGVVGVRNTRNFTETTDRTATLNGFACLGMELLHQSVRFQEDCGGIVACGN